ncbi:MAG: hypothetical protein CYG60_22815 [Actinobacteria bacterium]|nr:MAG: hypothetical protein CYG60_22815 [Actinomycetota bacterium]
MSRGWGHKQRKVVERLAAAPWEDGLSLSALRPVLGPDRSNARRVIRSLLARGVVERYHDPETGEGRLRLGFWAHIAATMKRERYFDEPEPVEGTHEQWETHD